MNQIGNRFYTSQVQSSIEKRTASELSGFCQSCTQHQNLLQHHLEHLRTAMALQFHNIFCGERVWSTHDNQHCLINQLSLYIQPTMPQLSVG